MNPDKKTLENSKMDYLNYRSYTSVKTAMRYD
jgi:hypothetical protein